MRGEMINEYQKLNSEDQKTFRRWLWANAVVGAILLTGLIALTSKFSGAESAATAQNATIHTQAKLPLESAPLCYPAVRAPRTAVWRMASRSIRFPFFKENVLLLRGIFRDVAIIDLRIVPLLDHRDAARPGRGRDQYHKVRTSLRRKRSNARSALTLRRINARLLLAYADVGGAVARNVQSPAP